MRGQIKIKDKTINYQIKSNSRAKNIRLAVYGDGSVVVTRPIRVPIFIVREFIKQKSDWLLKRVEKFSKIKSTMPVATKADYLRNKERARELISKKVTELNQVYGFQFNRISVRNQKTRWGSCSARGNLNFNYRIIYLSDNLIKYIVAHELCHLKELNHSNQFWNLVAVTVPDFKSARKELKNTK